MSLLTRIFTGVTILAVLASLYVGWNLKNRVIAQDEKIRVDEGKIVQLTKESADHKKKWEETAAELKTKIQALEETTALAERTKKDLDSQTNKTREAEEKLAKVTEEANKLNAEVDKIMKSLPEGMTIEQVQPKLKELQEKLVTLDQEKKTLIEQKAQLDLENKKLKEMAVLRREGKMPAGLTGHVLAVNEDWNFVVLDIGADQGVIGDAALIVHRNGNMIGKIKVTSIEPSIAIADILPDYSKQNIQEGDTVTP